MLGVTMVLVVVSLLLAAYSWKRGQALAGIKAGLKQALSFFPVIIIAFFLAGMLQVLLPQQFVELWLAREAGIKGVLLGTLGGSLLVIGPYTSFPIIASIYYAGAGLGTVIALITAWCLFSLTRLPYEAGFLGISFTLLRLAICLPLALLAGLVGMLIEKSFL